MKTIILIALLVLLVGCTQITDFEECVEAGNQVMESYPRQCKADDEIFIEVIIEDDVDNESVGDDRDDHGCIGSAGYQWCPSTQKCQRMWEEYCKEYADQYKEEKVIVNEGFEQCSFGKEWVCKRITTGELADPLVPNEIVCGCSPKTCPDDKPYLIVSIAGGPWPNGYKKGSFVCEEWPPA